MREADLVKKLKCLRCEYDGVVSEIAWRVERRKTVRKQLRRKEDWLQIRLLRLRNQLKQLNPKRWAFGAKKNKINRKYSDYSDNGYYACERCGHLFDFNRKKKTEVHSFQKCSEHCGLKDCGTLEQTHEFDWEHRSISMNDEGQRYAEALFR